MASATQGFAFVSWDDSSGRRVCPLATFGSREPQVLDVRLACAEPPRADQPELKNAEELRGSIALVVRGGCSFAHKARLLQRAGAVAMLLANNTREEPLAAFTMGESPEELEEEKKKRNEANQADPITMPCVMMCLRDVRELFQKFPPSVKSGVLRFEVLHPEEGALVAEECLKVQRELHEAGEAGKGWKAIKRTTTSIIKMLEPQTAIGSSTTEAPNATANGSGEQHSEGGGTCTSAAAPTREEQPPLLAFVQWATSASTYEICFAPLADFCSARAGASYTGKLVACDPLLGDKPIRNAEALSGAVALLKRGSCSFPAKLERVQRAGAVAAIVCNDDEEELDAAFVMSVDHIDAANATIPAVMISHNTFLRIQPALNVATTRILCQSGEAADGLLALSGESISFGNMPMANKRTVSANHDEENEDDTFEVPDLVYDLHKACRDGDHAACQRVLAGVEGKEAKQKLVNASCPSSGLTALHLACAADNDNVVEFLLQHGAAPDAVDFAVQTALHVACANRDVECARLLLRAEASAPQVPAVLYNVGEEYGGLAARRNIGGGTAMHEAARAGSAECVELLLSANARVESNTDGSTGRYIFLGVNAKDLEGSTPLHVACENAHAECALYLIAASADVNAKDSVGRSPLFLAFEVVNDPAKESDAVRIIEKLIASGATMEESNDENQLENNGGCTPLLLDRVDSPVLRRDFEVLYLRHEVQKAKQSRTEIRKKNEASVKRVEDLEDELATLRSLVDRHEAYQHQIQQLQLQMQMILQFQTSYGMQPSSAPIHDTGVTPLLAASLGDSTGKSEEELALDAALARDLGKKCLRQKQSVLAEKYFQRSLELMHLPGVHRLLETARRSSQLNESENASATKISLAVTSYTNALPLSTDMPSPSPGVKSAKIQHLVETVQRANATPQARAMLQSELDKLSTLSDEAEFALTCRWMEWLVALPWGDVNSGLQNEDLYSRKQNEFQQLDAIGAGRAEVYRDKASRTIQRIFRKQYAVHLRTRAVAASRIQAIVRGKVSRQRYKATKQQLLAAREERVAELAKLQDATEIETTKKVDYSTTVDRAIHRKLQRCYRIEELVAGHLLPNCGGQGLDKYFRVLQLVRCSGTGSTTPYASQTKVKHSSFFVWNRWGLDQDNMCECSLSGPYDDEMDAKRRLDRIIQDGEKRKTCHAPEVEDPYESGFDFLRSFVGGGAWGHSGSVASA